MNVRIHWVVGTAILVTVCVLPALFWYYDLERSWWMGQLILVPIAAITVPVLLVKRAYEACQKTLPHAGDVDADQLEEIPADVFCPACSYNLYRAPGAKCSECGYEIDGLRSSVCRIPWARRKELGRVRSYFSTVWMVTFDDRRFCAEYARSLDYTDARKFQWTTVLLAYVPADPQRGISTHSQWPWRWIALQGDCA